MPDDSLTAYLAEVQERWSMAAGMTWQDYETALELLAKALRSMADVPVLLAMAEAVLALHRPDGCHSVTIPCVTHANRAGSMVTSDIIARETCPRCVTTARPRCWQSGCPDEWPCPTYRAIAAALPGEDGA